MQISRRTSFKKTGVGAGLLLLVVALGAWFLFARGSNDLRRAGSNAVFAPVASLRLVDAMAPPGQDDFDDYAASELAVYTDAEVLGVVTAKLQEMSLPADALDISVKERHVRLRGRVADLLLRDAIEITVRAAPGVLTVDNQLEVVNPQ